MNLLALLFIILGGAFLVEGAAWAIFPRQIRRAYQMVFQSGDKDLHIFGLVNVIIGVIMVGIALKFLLP
ncbi:MAG: DUF2065 domain-containing protein [Maricaulaceae bacterium]